MFEVKTRFRFSSEGGVGEKTRFGGGRFVIGTPSLPLHKPFLSLPLHKPFLSLPYHTNLFYLSHYTNLFYLFLITQTFFISPITQTFFISSLSHKPFSSLTPHMPFSIISIPHTNIISPTSSSSTQKKNRIGCHQSYLKHYLIDLFN